MGYKRERRDDERTCTSGRVSLLPSIDLGSLPHFLLARFASFCDEPGSSARNLAACSGLFSASYSSSRSVRALLSQFAGGLVCFIRSSNPARLSFSASE